MALSGIQLSAGIVVGSNTAVDAKYGPYADLATAKSEIGVSLRYLGLTVGIETSGTVEEYWWESGTADGDLGFYNWNTFRPNRFTICFRRQGRRKHRNHGSN